ncbi:MAG TPA: TIR domain-containing protein [Pseudomonadales bacterium]|nr:TIR domain-containing protein [Pseudomonadales bacterium]
MYQSDYQGVLFIEGTPLINRRCPFFDLGRRICYIKREEGSSTFNSALQSVSGPVPNVAYLIIEEGHPMNHEVFVSHSSKDKTIADGVVACLEGRGLRCWVAPRDIIAGSDWGASIIDGIYGAKVMLLILSKHSNISKQVLREIERAANRGIPILPFLVDNVPLTKSLEYFLSSSHWLDAYRGDLKKHIETLANSVANILERQDAVVEIPQSHSTKTSRTRLKPIFVVSFVLFSILALVYTRWQSQSETVPMQSSNAIVRESPAPPPSSQEAAKKRTATIQGFLDDGDFTSVLEIDPINAEALQMSRQTKIKVALLVGDYKAVLELDPKNAEALEMVRQETIKTALSKGDYKNVLELDPKNAEALEMALQEKIKTALSKGDYKNVLDLDPENAEALALKKNTQIKNFLDDRDYESALKLDPKNKIALAMQRQENIRLALASGDFEAALAIDPENKDALTMKNTIEYKTGFSAYNLLPIVAEKLGAPTGGIGVTFVYEEQKCGIKVGDVIVKFNGTHITNCKEIKAAGFSEVRSNTEYPITIVRNGKPIEMTFTPVPREKKEEPEDDNIYLTFGQVDQFEMASPKVFIEQFSISGGIAMALDPDGLASYWELKDDGPVLNTFKDRLFSAIGAATNGDKFVLANARNGELLVWNPVSKSIEGIMEGHPNQEVIAVLLSDDGKKAVTITKKGSVRTWDLRTRKRLKDMTLHGLARDKLWWAGTIGVFRKNFSISASGRYLGQHIARAFAIFDLEKGGLHQNIEISDDIAGSALSPDASLIALGFKNGRIEIRDPVKNELIHTLRWHTGDADLVSFLSTNILLSSSYDQRDSQLIIWDFKTESPLWGYHFTEDNDFFAYGPKHARYDRDTKSLFAGTATIRKLDCPDVLISSLDRFQWAEEPLSEPMKGMGQSPFSVTTTAKSELGDGSSTESVFYADGSRLITKRNTGGTITEMQFIPTASAVDLGLLLQPLSKPTPLDKSGHHLIEDGVKIRKLVRGGQAERDNILCLGDVIDSIEVAPDEFKPTKGMYIAQLHRYFYGPENSTLRLKIFSVSSDESRTVTVNRGIRKAFRSAPIKSDWQNELGMHFVMVPPGQGTLGIDGLFTPSHVPKAQYTRRTSGFLMAIHEVTQDDFEKVMGRNPSTFSHSGAESNVLGNGDTAFHPVESVTWDEAIEFCELASKLHGVQYRLPTEFEWEWACRNGGLQSWEWNDNKTQIEEMAVDARLQVDSPLAVGSRSPNSLGIFDMYGNVAEWCLDWQHVGTNRRISYVDPKGPETGIKKLIRGGSYKTYGNGYYEKVALATNEKRRYIGFRIIIEQQNNSSNENVKNVFANINRFSYDLDAIPKVLPLADFQSSTDKQEKKAAEVLSNRVNSGEQITEEEFLKRSSSNQRYFTDLRGQWKELFADDPAAAAAFIAYNNAHASKRLGKQDVLGLQIARQKHLFMGWPSNDLAWSLATNPYEEFRDGEMALQYAIAACETVKWQYWGFIDTLAAALAEAGEFKEAVRLAEAARKMAPETEYNVLDESIRLYRNGETLKD